jgi:hypothetical protein
LHTITGAFQYLPGIGTDSAAIAGAKLAVATRAIMQIAKNLAMIADDKTQVNII